jgi:hypothetical protein
LPKTRVDEVAERKINQAVTAPKGHGWLRAIGSQRHQAFSFATGENDSKDFFRCHGPSVLERRVLY